MISKSDWEQGVFEDSAVAEPELAFWLWKSVGIPVAGMR